MIWWITQSCLNYKERLHVRTSPKIAQRILLDPRRLYVRLDPPSVIQIALFADLPHTQTLGWPSTHFTTSSNTGSLTESIVKIHSTSVSLTALGLVAPLVPQCQQSFHNGRLKASSLQRRRVRACRMINGFSPLHYNTHAGCKILGSSGNADKATNSQRRARQ